MTARERPCEHCGGFPSRQRLPRSVPQHRRYFGIVRAAFMHWPEAHGFQPHSEEHLRHWLQVKVQGRWHNVLSLDPSMMTMRELVSAIRSAGPFPFAAVRNGQLEIMSSKSIAFDALPHLEACALFDQVAEVIETETGLRCDDLLRITPRKSKKPPSELRGKIRDCDT